MLLYEESDDEEEKMMGRRGRDRDPIVLTNDFQKTEEAPNARHLLKIRKNVHVWH